MSLATGVTAARIQFYDTGMSPFAQRVWVTLLEKQLNFDVNIVDLKNKSKHFTDLYTSIHPDPSAPAKVPVMIDGRNQLIESNVICEYLDSTYSKSGPKLFPDDPYKSAKVRWFVSLFSELFVAGWFKLLAADSPQALDQAEHNFDNVLRTLNTFIKQNSFEGEFLLGKEYSYAEVATAPFMHHADLTLQHYRGYSIKAALQQHDLNHLRGWIMAASVRPSFLQTIPNSDEMVAAWTVCVSEFKGHVKQ